MEGNGEFIIGLCVLSNWKIITNDERSAGPLNSRIDRNTEKVIELVRNDLPLIVRKISEEMDNNFEHEGIRDIRVKKNITYKQYLVTKTY
jgi:hypothetical protein